jgi:4-carboxymuconolactone decarboxylase
MTFLKAAIAFLSLAVSSVAQANDIRAVAPALEKYAQDRLFGEVWKRPGLSPRDRSVVTLAVLIARNQTVEMPYYVNLALDHGVKPAEISEIIMHLAFYSGWANAMSAVAATKDVFAKRRIGSDQLPPVSPQLLPLNEAAEKERATRVGQQFGAVSPGVVQTPPTSCSAISGCARTSRPGIGVSSPSAP